MPSVRITDILIEVDEKLHFTDAFTDLRTGIACGDRIGAMTVLLADGVNLGLRKMADACDTHTFWELLRIGKWHVREETTARALAMIVEAQSKLPMARFWGDGTTSSSDGQHFPAGSTGEALNVVNARYGNEPGLSAYSHVSDQYAPYSTQIIPATAHEAPYILDGLLQNDTGRQIREHYADTGGFTDHVFAICSVLGFRFAPRIRDLPDRRLYVPALDLVPPALQPLIGGRINIRLIRENWSDILRLAASMAAGTVVPSQILRKLAAYPRQNSLALALREVGRLERSIFMLDWLSDIDLQRRAQIGLNKGEAHHALKRAVNFNRRGEIRRPVVRRTATPNCRSQPPHRHHHLLEHMEARRNRRRAIRQRRPRASSSRLTARMGAYNAHRGISVAAVKVVYRPLPQTSPQRLLICAVMP
jgi:TnpA family transposase